MTSEPRNGLAATLETIRADADLPALAAAVLSSEGLVDRAAVGVRKLGDATEVEQSDRFHLGSCTKTMTAALIATFVDDEALAWDTPLFELLPDLAGDMHADFADVTLADLLAHRAGLAEVHDHPESWAQLWQSDDPLPAQRRRFAAQVLAKPPSHPPRQRPAYSNVGYIVAGAALEAQTGKSWEELMQARLFDPRGMASCGFGPAGSADGVDQPLGHDVQRRPMQPGPRADNPPALGPAGTVHCNLEDWARFIAVFVDEDQDLISGGSMERLTTPPDGQQFALGWIVAELPFLGGEPVLFHNGSNTFNYAAAVVAPHRGQAFLVATNWGKLEVADAAAAEVFKHLADEHAP